MPTYDYLCPSGHRFEVLHSVTADSPTTCPICHEGPVRKAFSAPTIHFKGSGWAKKDRSSASRSASKAASAGSETGSASGSGSDPGGGTASDKGQAASSDGTTVPDAKPAIDKKPSGDKGKTSGSSSGATAAD